MNVFTENDDHSSTRIIQDRAIERMGHSYRRELSVWVQIAVAYMSFLILLQILILKSYPLNLAFVPLFVLDLKICTVFIIENWRNGCKVLLSKEIIDQVSSISFKILLLVHLNLKPYKAYIILVPVIVSILNQIIYRVNRSQECKYLTWLIITISKLLFFLTLINVSLKEEKVISWSITGILWPVYIGLSLCGVISLGISLFTVGSFLSWSSSELSSKEMITTLWLFITSIGSTLSLISICMSVSGSSILNQGDFYLIFPACFLLVFIVSTSIFMKTLVKWWVLFFNQNITAPSIPENSAENSASQRNRIIRSAKKPLSF